MKEELISFETAKLAKEKGFDEKGCSHLYQLDEKLVAGNRETYQNRTHCITAPTQSLLQKWLREEHNYFVAIYPIKDGWDGDVRSCNPKDNFHSSDTSFSTFKTYEEALEKGLYEALKLIKI